MSGGVCFGQMVGSSARLGDGLESASGATRAGASAVGIAPRAERSHQPLKSVVWETRDNRSSGGFGRTFLRGVVLHLTTFE